MTGDKRGCLAAAPCLSKPPREQAISQVVSCLFLGVCNVGKGTVPVRGESRAQSPAAPAAAWALASGSVSILLCGHLLGASVSQCEVARCAVPQCVSPLNIPAPERLDSPCLLGDAGGSWGPASWNHRSPLPQAAVHTPALPPCQLRELAPHSFRDSPAVANGSEALPAHWQLAGASWSPAPAPGQGHQPIRSSDRVGRGSEPSAAREKPGLTRPATGRGPWGAGRE